MMRMRSAATAGGMTLIAVLGNFIEDID